MPNIRAFLSTVVESGTNLLSTLGRLISDPLFGRCESEYADLNIEVCFTGDSDKDDTVPTFASLASENTKKGLIEFSKVEIEPRFLNASVPGTILRNPRYMPELPIALRPSSLLALTDVPQKASLESQFLTQFSNPILLRMLIAARNLHSFQQGLLLRQMPRVFNLQRLPERDLPEIQMRKRDSMTQPQMRNIDFRINILLLIEGCLCVTAILNLISVVSMIEIHSNPECASPLMLEDAPKDGASLTSVQSLESPQEEKANSSPQQRSMFQNILATAERMLTRVTSLVVSMLVILRSVPARFFARVFEKNAGAPVVRQPGVPVMSAGL